MTMISKFGKATPSKTANTGFQLNPSYIYDIELRIQTANWMKQSIRNLQTSVQKPDSER
jgi:hypothetical protein